MITLPSGRLFNLFEPRMSDLTIEDLAHLLSMCPRWGGACQRFYSVAEHSVWVHRICGRGLLHDAAEGPWGFDIPTPLKKHPNLLRVVQAQDYLQSCIDEHFGVVSATYRIHLADELMKAVECHQIPVIGHNYADPKVSFHVECWSPERAREEFLRAWYQDY